MSPPSMDLLPANGDTPFFHESTLQKPFVLHGISRDERLVTCHVSEMSYRFPRPYLVFIKLLLLVNDEITGTWENEDEEDQVYWISLRAYLNMSLQNTLTCLNEKQCPMALTCWLHREFMLCRHDDAGRREYLELMEQNGIEPYSLDIFELGESFFFLSCHQLIMIHLKKCHSLDWLTWWKKQFQQGYYTYDHFWRFNKLLNEEQAIIKVAASRQMWNDMEYGESNVFLTYYLVHSFMFGLTPSDFSQSRPSSRGSCSDNSTLPSVPTSPHAEVQTKPVGSLTNKST